MVQTVKGLEANLYPLPPRVDPKSLSVDKPQELLRALQETISYIQNLPVYDQSLKESISRNFLTTNNLVPEINVETLFADDIYVGGSVEDDSPSLIISGVNNQILVKDTDGNIVVRMGLFTGDIAGIRFYDADGNVVLALTGSIKEDVQDDFVGAYITDHRSELQGPQGRFELRIYINSAAAPATPTGGTYNLDNGVFVPPLGWSFNPADPPTGQDTYFSKADIDPATDTGVVDLTWSESTPAGGTGPAGPPGTDGDDGQDGMDGQDGTAGIAGADGSDGQVGTTGQTGAPGTPGTDGDDGVAGTDGNDGQAGTTGQTGATGTPGTDGQTGASGVDGIPGEDGVGYEFIFTVTAGIQIPSNQRPLNSWGYDQPVSVNGLTWHDAAPNVTSILQYLWRSQRVVVGTPSSGDAVTDQWTQPTIQSRYSAPGSQGPEGTAGTDGEDGATGPAGATGTPGTDGQTGATGTPGTPGATGTPGTPGQTGATGTPGTPGNDGAVGDQGVKGDPGVGVEYIFAVTPVSFANDDDEWAASAYAPSNAWGFDEPATVTVVAASRISDVEELIWTDGATALDSSVVELLWRAERPTAGTPAVGDVVSDDFLTPVIVHRSTDTADYLEVNPITTTQIVDGAINLGGNKVTGVLQLAHIDADVQNTIPVWGGSSVTFDTTVGNKIYLFELIPSLRNLLPHIPGAEGFTADYIFGIGEPTVRGSFGMWGVAYDDLVVGTNQAVPSTAKEIFIIAGEEIKVWRNGAGTKIFMKPTVVGEGGTIHDIVAVKNPDGTGTSSTSITADIVTNSEDEDYIYYREPGLGERITSAELYIEGSNQISSASSDGDYIYSATGARVFDFEGVRQQALESSSFRNPRGSTIFDSHIFYSHYVNSTTSYEVRVKNLSTGLRVSTKEFSLALENFQPGGFANDGTYLYVVDYSDVKVYVYRLSDGARQGTREFNLHPDNAASHSVAVIEDFYLAVWNNDTSGAEDLNRKTYVYRLSDGVRQANREFITGRLLDDQGTALEGDDARFWGMFYRSSNRTLYLLANSSYIRIAGESYVNIVSVWQAYQELPTNVPSGDTDVIDDTPEKWNREILGQNGGRFYLSKRTRSFQNERFLDATVFDDFEEVTGNFTIPQYLWRKGSTTPSNPSGGTTSENHEPTNYSRDRLLSDASNNVYRWKRDATYDVDGDFVSATIWGGRVQTAPAA